MHNIDGNTGKKYSHQSFKNAKDISTIKSCFTFMFGPSETSDVETPKVPAYFDDSFFTIVSQIKKQISEEGKDGNYSYINFRFRYFFTIAAFIDTIQLLVKTSGNYYEIASIDIYDSLDVEERKIVNYLKGIIKHAKDLLSVDRTNIRDEDIAPILRSIISDVRRDPGEEFKEHNIEPILSKFPRLKKVGSFLNFYSDTIVKKSNLDSKNMPLNVREDLKKVISIVGNLKKSMQNESYVYENNFKTFCLESINRNDDPMQAFNSFNPVFKNESNLKNTVVSDEEINLISHFMLDAKTEFNPQIPGNFSDPRSFVSGLERPSKVYHNLKVVNKIVGLTGDIGISHVENNLYIAFVKKDRNGKIKSRLGMPHSLSDVVRSSKRVIPRNGNFFSPPIVERDKADPQLLKFSRIDLPNSLRSKVYFMSRPVSQNCFYSFYGSQNPNSVYQSKIINVSLEGEETQFEEELSTEKNIQRIHIAKENNESITFSKVTKDFNFSYHKISAGRVSNIEDKIRSTTAVGFSVSDQTEENNKAINVIKLINLPEDVKVKKVTFAHGLVINNFSTNKMEEMLSFAEGSSEIIHFDPVPGDSYTYKIELMEKYTGIITKDATIEVVVKTFKGFNENVKLISTNNPIKNDNGTFFNVSLKGLSLDDYRENNINRVLDSLFPENQNNDSRNTYAEKVREKFNSDYSLVGNSFSLMVQKYEKRSGNLISESFIQADEESISENKINFLIPVPRHIPSTMIISYNLVINNPFHDSVIEKFEIEEVVEGEDVNKTRFLRKTSKFFNSHTISMGTLPGPGRDARGNEVRKDFNSPFPYNFPISRATFIGNLFEYTKDFEIRDFHFSIPVRATALKNGEFDLQWLLRRPTNYSEHSADFFIITCIISSNKSSNQIEFPIASHPYLCSDSPAMRPEMCRLRTKSFEGIADQVKFRVYIVDNYFNISKTVSTTNSISVKSRYHYVHTDGRRPAPL